MKQRAALAAIGAVLVVGVVGAAALAVRSSDDGRPETIRIAPKSAGGRNAAPTAEGAADMSVARMVRYVLADGVTLLDGKAHAWKYDTAPSKDAVSRLAKAFGLTGDVVAPAEGGWKVGTPEVDSPGIMVEPSFEGRWWYSPGFIEGLARGCAEPAKPIDPAAASASDQPAVTDCTATPPPEGVPTAAEAEQLARTLFVSAGFDLGDAVVRVEGDEYFRQVIVDRRLDGAVLEGWQTVSYGAKAVVQYAGGVLGEPKKADAYPRIGTVKAVELLNSGSGQWWFGTGVRDAVADTGTEGGGSSSGGSGSTSAGSDGASTPPTPGIAVGEPTPETTVVHPTPNSVPPDVPLTTPPVPPTSDPSGPAQTPPPVPAEQASSSLPPETVVAPPVETVPVPETTVPPEPVEVKITAAAEALFPIYGADGVVWLLPAYDLTMADGGRMVVPAIDSSFIEEVQPPVTKEPTPAPLPADTKPAVTATPTDCDSAPDRPSCLAVDWAAKVVGLPEADAEREVRAAGLDWRVVARDGEGLAVTDDWNGSRINVKVEGGVVASAAVF
ncbi:MAG TPA: hypothetical protein VF855_02305 [Acidimicrobiales bacterium]